MLGQFTMGQGFLANFQMGKRVSDRLQSIRGTGLMAKGPGVTTVGQHGVYQEPPAVSSTKFVSV